MVSYPRRQQYRRMVRAGGTATGSVAATLLALALASARALWVAATLVFLAVGSAFYALSLANRSRMGARWEAGVAAGVLGTETSTCWTIPPTRKLTFSSRLSPSPMRTDASPKF